MISIWLDPDSPQGEPVGAPAPKAARPRCDCSPAKCDECDGYGMIFHWSGKRPDCSDCRGSGKIHAKDCPAGGAS